MIVELSEYVLEVLRKDEKFILYRGQHHQSQVNPQSILVLVPVSTRPAPKSLERMEHEYSLRAELDRAWAVRPVALSPHKGQPMLMFEHPSGEHPNLLIQGPIDMIQF